MAARAGGGGGLSGDPSERARERARLGRIFGGYAASTRKRRAWRADNPGNIAIRRELTDAVFAVAGDAIAGGGPILDVGCGTGWWLAELAARGVDPSRLHGVEMLEERAAATAARVPGARAATGDARALPFPDGEFALVTLFTVLSSLVGEADVEAALGEAARLLAPGGILAVWEPRIPNPLNRATRLVGTGTLRAALGTPMAARSLTVLPGLARRLPASAYAPLAALPPLRTHRLVVWRG